MKKILLLLPAILGYLFICAQSWDIKGNAGTNPDSNFVGTIDAKPLLFRVYNVKAGQINPATNNTSFGVTTLNFNTTGINNTALGSGALSNNTSGQLNTALGTFSLLNNTLGSLNTAVGAYSMYTNSGGVWNTAQGQRSLYANTSGNGNVAIGEESLLSNLTGSGNVGIGFMVMAGNTAGGGNVAIGDQAFKSNTSGDYNVAVGRTAMISNTSGAGNVAVGKDAMYWGSTGKYNTAVGTFSLNKTTISQYNTALGYNAAYNYNMGWNNTILGANCDVNAANLYNCIAIGQGVICTGVSQARIGNSATISIGGYVGWSNISDGRFKKDVKDNVKGLDFIMRLQPVTYHLDVAGIDNKLHEGLKQEPNESMQKAMAGKEKTVYSGFIAQDVEKAAKEAGYDFSGVDKPQDKNDLYGLRYAEFVVPLVKATQEQQQTIEEQGEMIKELIKQNTSLQKRIEELEKSAGVKQTPAVTDLLSIWPNPSDGKLFISINTTQKTTAVINVTDAKGAIIKREQKQLVPGDNQFNVDIKGVANGIYTVSAEWNDGRMKRSSQVIKQ